MIAPHLRLRAMFPRLTLAADLEELVHEHAADATDDAAFAELLLPELLVRLEKTVGRRRLIRALEELRDATAPKAAPQLGVPCWRTTAGCARSAIAERLDPNGSGIWQPVCADHLRGALPLEIRKFPHGTRGAGGGKRVA